MEVRLLTPPVQGYDDPLQGVGARDVEGDAAAFHLALVQSRAPLLLVRPTVRYFGD